MAVTNATYAELVERAEILERGLIRAKAHFQRIYKSSTQAGIVEGECGVAISAIESILEQDKA